MSAFDFSILAEIVVVCPERLRLDSLKAASLETLREKEYRRLRFCTPEEFSAVLLELAALSRNKELVSHGKRIRVKHKAVSAEEIERRRAFLAQITVRSLQKLKRESGS